MKINFLKSFAILTVFSAVMTGCITDDSYNTPDSVINCTEPTLVVNKTVAEIKAMASGTPTLYTSETTDVIEGYVTSSDERGNFFKVVSMQTLVPAGTAPVGFSVAIDGNSLFGQGYKPGNKVYVVLNGLHYAIVDGSLKFGALYEGQIGRISQFDYAEKAVPSCTVVAESELVRSLTVAEALNNNNINTLIELQNVQFNEGNVGGTYYDGSDETNTMGGATNRFLMDSFGNQIIFRTSSFANFSGDKIPANSGKIRGVLTKFGSTYQFMARSATDIMLTEPRFDVAPPIVGDAIVYSGSFTETFESYVTSAPGNRTFPMYINDAAIGGRYWATTAFGGNKYIQMTSFGGAPEANRTLFIVPVDMTAANGFSFQSKIGFANGPALKVYYSLNYVPGGKVTDATLIDITSSFTLSPGQTSGYPAAFTNSGTYAIPANLTGNGYFIFEYVGNGNGGVTSTVQLDNIVVN